MQTSLAEKHREAEERQWGVREQKGKRSGRKDLRFRNGTREREQREKKPMKKMIHSETKYSFILKD